MTAAVSPAEAAEEPVLPSGATAAGETVGDTAVHVTITASDPEACNAPVAIACADDRGASVSVSSCDEGTVSNKGSSDELISPWRWRNDDWPTSATLTDQRCDEKGIVWYRIVVHTGERPASNALAPQTPSNRTSDAPPPMADVERRYTDFVRVRRRLRVVSRADAPAWLGDQFFPKRLVRNTDRALARRIDSLRAFVVAAVNAARDDPTIRRIVGAFLGLRGDFCSSTTTTTTTSDEAHVESAAVGSLDPDTAESLVQEQASLRGDICVQQHEARRLLAEHNLFVAEQFRFLAERAFIARLSWLTAAVVGRDEKPKGPTSYEIHVVAQNGDTWNVMRRFSDFCFLREACRELNAEVPEPFPPKTLFKAGRDTLEARQTQLNKYLTAVVGSAHASLPLRQVVSAFLSGYG
ncbi:hypothetical protein DIPPA_26612 [Diplonema papillatum]|nr:hypothetical protein DIPPA_26612 [Diplonema papillatum]